MIRADAGELLAGSIRLVASDAHLASAVTVLPEGAFGIPPHLHHTSSEVFLVLDGVLQALVDDQVLTLGAGDSFVAGASVLHALAPAPGSSATVFVTTVPPADRPEYYRQLDAVHRGTLSRDELLEQQQRFDSYFHPSAAWDARNT